MTFCHEPKSNNGVDMKKFVAAICMALWTVVATATPTEVRILKQAGQTSNMMLLYPTIHTFERLAREAGTPVRVVLQPMDNVSTGVTNMLAGNTDIIMGAVIPFAFAIDKVPDRLQLLSGSNVQNMDLICSNPEIRRVTDIRPTHKIAMKTLGSSDHFTLRGIAKKYFGDYYHLDKNIITMPRPQIAALMASKDNSIDCAVPGTPLQGSLVKAGHARLIVSSDQKEILGNIHGTWTSTRWLKQNPRLAELWIRAVRITAQELERNIDPAIEMFRNTDNAKDSFETIKETLVQSQQRYSVAPVGIAEQLQVLHAMGLTKNRPPPLEQLLWRPDLVK